MLASVQEIIAELSADPTISDSYKAELIERLRRKEAELSSLTQENERLKSSVWGPHSNSAKEVDYTELEKAVNTHIRRMKQHSSLEEISMELLQILANIDNIEMKEAAKRYEVHRD